MKFRQFKADMILEGTKTASLRLFDDKDLSIGDKLELINWETGEPFAHAQITEVIEKPLNKINEHDLIGHEPYKDQKEMIESLKKYYPSSTPETRAKIVRFKISE